MGVYAPKVKLVGKKRAAQGSRVGRKGVGARPADGDHRASFCKQFVPFTQRLWERATRHLLRVEGVKNGPRSTLHVRFEFGHSVPQFEAGVILPFPIHPGDIWFSKDRGRWIHRIGDESQTARIANAIQQTLWLL